MQPRLTLQHLTFVFVFLMTLSLAHAQVPWLHVEGNQIKDETGNPVTLRGVSVLAPEHNNECTTCNNKPISEMITWQADASLGWHSRVLRLQVTTAKVSDPATSFATMIDPYVQQAIAKGLYVIVDLHFVANYDYNGSGGVSQSSVLDFWKYVAPRYANTPNVIFEVFNEPISPDCWSCWKEYIQPVVNAIRAVAPNNLILMGGPQWSTRVNPAVSDPVIGNNIVYVYHIYPNQGQASETNLNSKFGNASQTIPVMITEFGWNQDANYSNTVTHGTTSAWGTPFRQYVDSRPQISWTSYIFDNFWKPQYFDWRWNLMSGENQGQFMQQWFLEMKDHNQPQPAQLTAAAVTSGQINLTWPAVSGASSYNVKRSTTSGGPYAVVATNVTATNYSDIGLNSQTTYYYVVSAVTSGTEAPDSAEVSATTEGTGHTPDVPIRLQATGGVGEVALTWRAAPGASSYSVKRSTVSGGPYSTIASGVTTPTYTDTSVTNGTVYYYVVSAVSSKESVNSAEASDVPSSIVVLVDNPAAILQGAWTSSSATPGFYGADYFHDGNTGTTGGKRARFSPDLPSAGSYYVSVRWTSASNRASNAPVHVNHAGGTANLSINQQQQGGHWVRLGIFSFNADTSANVIIRNDGANGYVIADAVKFALSSGNGNISPTASFLYSATGLTVDYDASGSWDGDGSIAQYSWDFGDGTSGSGVTVSHTYAAAGNYAVVLTVTDNSSAADTLQQTVTVYDGGNSGDVTTLIVNQQQNGGVMNELGTFSFDAGTAGSVKIRTDGTNGYVTADAVKFSKVGQSDIILDSEGTEGIILAGAWATSNVTPGYLGASYLHDGNAGKGTKSVTYVPNLPVAGAWTVSVQWVSHTNRATNVPIDITHVAENPSGIPSTIHVESITKGSQSAGQGFKQGTVTILIQDSVGNPVNGATVAGSFSGDFNEIQSGSTGMTGMVTLVTTAIQKGTLNFNFCVDSVSHTSGTYDPAQNVITCTEAGSNPARVTIAENSMAQEIEVVRLYPNPAKQTVSLDLSYFSQEPVQVKITNSIGQLFKSVAIAGSDQYEINTASLRSGSYWVTVTGRGKVVVKKLLIE